MREIVVVSSIDRNPYPAPVCPRDVVVTSASELSAAVAETSRNGVLRVKGRNYLLYESGPFSKAKIETIYL